MKTRRDQTPLVIMNSINEFIDELIAEKEKEIVENEALLNQSQMELEKLTKKNASVTAELQKIQTQSQNVTAGGIPSAFENALEAQQRLFLMRGNVEKLQSDRNHLQEQKKMLEKIKEELHKGIAEIEASHAGFDPVEGIEMIIQAQEAERQRLSRQMHDGPAQSLSNFILQTEIAMRLFDLDAQKAKEELESLKSSATQTFQKVRDFIFELRPMMLDDLGLLPTLKRYVDALQTTPGVTFQLTINGMERRLEPYLEVMIFRAVQELLNNAIRYSQANQIQIQITLTESEIEVQVMDNGKGFDPQIIEKNTTMGLKVIRDRVDLLGGTFLIDSQIGKGSKIKFTLPIVENAA
jgi:two-component system sensor histidine kinase DegS